MDFVSGSNILCGFCQEDKRLLRKGLDLYTMLVFSSVPNGEMDILSLKEPSIYSVICLAEQFSILGHAKDLAARARIFGGCPYTC